MSTAVIRLAAGEDRVTVLVGRPAADGRSVSGIVRSPSGALGAEPCASRATMATAMSDGCVATQ